MKLKRICLLLLILATMFKFSGSALALTSDPEAFDEVWSELFSLDDNERANSYTEWRSREEYQGSPLVPQANSTPILLAGDIEEHHLDLPETEHPWLIHIEDFNLAISDPELVHIKIIDAPSGGGSINVVTPNDFIDLGGSITVDPYSHPPQVKIKAGSPQLMQAAQFTITIKAPVATVVADASLPLQLLNFQGSRLDLLLQGDYHLDLQDAHLEELKIEAVGYGDFKLSGHVDYVSTDLSGSMEFDSTELSTKKLHARLDGPMSAHFGDSEQSILEVRGTMDITPPGGDLIRLDD